MPETPGSSEHTILDPFVVDAQLFMRMELPCTPEQWPALRKMVERLIAKEDLRFGSQDRYVVFGLAELTRLEALYG